MRRRRAAGVLAFALAVAVAPLAWAPAPARAESAPIRDLETIPQSAARLLVYPGAAAPAVSPRGGARMDAAHRTAFFAPWRGADAGAMRAVMLHYLQGHRAEPGFGENGVRRTRAFYDAFAREMAPDGFPNAGWRAVVVAPSDLRELPTGRPRFKKWEAPGDGYPFDLLQYSAIAPATPVWVAHESRSRDWAFVSSHYGPAWMPLRDLARVDDALARRMEAAPQVALVKDDVALSTPGGRHLFTAGLGAVFPVAEGGDPSRILVPRADASGRAVLVAVTAPPGTVARKPLPLTQENIARLADEMMGKPYGWGGMYANRDCSALMKDLFAPFGLMLPRNSKEQARDGGAFVPLDGLDAARKERIIRESAVPFLTLLWMPGHIMLAAGVRDGRPIVFHSFWGVRTRSLLGTEGRLIVGRAALTTLSPGRELRALDPARGDLLPKIAGMVFLAPPGP